MGGLQDDGTDTRQWYYAEGDQRKGPVLGAELKRLLRAGLLKRDVLVWTDTLQDWAPANSLPQLGGPPPSVRVAPRRRRIAAAGYAGFWKRFLAAFIDGILVNAVAFVAGFALGFGVASSGGGVEGLEAVANLIGIVVGWAYYAAMESSTMQATLGKMALGIKVTDLNGDRISFGRATGRHFGKIISGAICLIGFIMAAFTEKKQALHDIMAGCLVVNK